MIPYSREMTPEEAEQNRLDIAASSELGAKEPVEMKSEDIEFLASSLENLASKIRNGKALFIEAHWEAGLADGKPYVDGDGQAWRAFRSTGVKRLEFIYKEVLAST